jgi:hypothetical protein
MSFIICVVREGEFKMGKMHGTGFFTFPTGKDGTPGETEEALMRDNILVCLKKGVYFDVMSIVSMLNICGNVGIVCMRVQSWRMVCKWSYTISLQSWPITLLRESSSNITTRSGITSVGSRTKFDHGNEMCVSLCCLCCLCRSLCVASSQLNVCVMSGRFFNSQALQNITQSSQDL